MRTIQKKKPERLIAAQKGEKFYFTGRPCVKGHVAKRITADASCFACRQEQVIQRRDSGVGAQYARQTRARDPEKAREQWRKDRSREKALHPERVRERERVRSARRRKENPKKKLAQVRKRQVAKMQRTPSWADLKAIQRFYEDCPVGMEIDHIIPLRGTDVSGLHVLENLQYLTPAENREKLNKFDSEIVSLIELERIHKGIVA